MARFRKLPVVIDAVRWDGTNYSQMYSELGVDDDVIFRGEFGSLFVPTLEGEMRADPGDYIIRGINGEYYPCKPDIFEKTYEPA